TLRNTLDKVEDWFTNRHLEINRIRGKGVIVTGEEYNKRIAIRDVIIVQESEERMLRVLRSFSKGIPIKEICSVIRDAEQDWKIKFSKESFYKILVMLVLSLSRFSKPLKSKSTEKLENI